MIAPHRTRVAALPLTPGPWPASLTYYRVLQSLIGHSPGDVELDAFLTAWVDSAVATLNPGGPR
jgi:hypothetical protein